MLREADSQGYPRSLFKDSIGHGVLQFKFKATTLPFSGDYHCDAQSTAVEFLIELLH